MKGLIRELMTGKNPLVSGSIAMAITLSIALGCNCNRDFNLSNSSNGASTGNSSTTDTRSDAAPPKSTAEALIKDTTAKFRDAVDLGDFSELYNDASADFRGTYTLDQVTDAFKSYTDKKKVVVPILDRVDNATFEWDRDPTIRTEKNLNILMVSGKFNTKPYSVRTDYEYVQRGGEWKLLKLVINIP